MTELFEVASRKISPDELTPKVTIAIEGIVTGMFLVGLFYERNGLLYCYSVPGNEKKSRWCKTPDEAIDAWQAISGAHREVINPLLPIIISLRYKFVK